MSNKQVRLLLNKNKCFYLSLLLSLPLPFTPHPKYQNNNIRKLIYNNQMKMS